MPVPKSTVESSPRKLLRDVVYDKMLAALRDGTLQHGERLNDDELVQWLGVSRTPIREAIAKLVDIGLVEMEANRYTRVATPTFEDWVTATRATAGFFELSLRWGVPEYSDEDVEALSALLDKADRMRKVRDYGFSGALTEIIEFAVEHSGNPLVQNAAVGAMERVRFTLNPTPAFEQYGSEAFFSILREALTERDGEGAAEAGRALTRNFEQHIEAVRADRG
ncbi:GntR family transcriptional regulator [Curtobacterium aurantiacum]|uniref:GntR family transcriptional regulator n=1 Tax=Curtobacterium aurantiacum TaxID=3236919 RepID=UPI001BE0D595|nr:GntR family transcriptional regulator [Curtobacterium flaccumfaciens]MBT1675936.1 GntR family transcriptional regulator [Curtobacterium flaccumfaciens pv. flaccumfaciens]